MNRKGKVYGGVGKVGICLAIAATSALGQSAGFDKTMRLGGSAFRVFYPGDQSDSGGTFEIDATGQDNRRVVTTLTDKRNGPNQQAWVADLDGSGKAEIAVWIQKNDNRREGDLKIYSFDGSRLRGVGLKGLGRTEGDGRRGDDRFTLSGDVFRRTFPVYNRNDADYRPTGGTRTLALDFRGRTWRLLSGSDGGFQPGGPVFNGAIDDADRRAQDIRRQAQRGQRVNGSFTSGDATCTYTGYFDGGDPIMLTEQRKWDDGSSATIELIYDRGGAFFYVENLQDNSSYSYDGRLAQRHDSLIIRATLNGAGRVGQVQIVGTQAEPRGSRFDSRSIGSLSSELDRIARRNRR